MGDKVERSTGTYRNVMTELTELQLDDVTDYPQPSVTNGYARTDGEQKSETPSSESSDCESVALSDDSSRKDNYHTMLQVVTEPLIINVKKATKFRDNPDAEHTGVYCMRSKPRGIVLIIANNLYKNKIDQRSGAKHDSTNLKKLFKDMGFEVITHSDLTGKQIDETIDEFSKMPELKKVDSAFIIISSHGTGRVGLQETEILGIDYETHGYKKVNCTSIINYFTANNCDFLKGKPKIFIFQTCRGDIHQYAVPRSRADTPNLSRPTAEQQYINASETFRDHEDMLIVYSTIPGYVSYRDQYNGSWFIQILCEVFMNHAYKFHLQDLFAMIDYRLKTMRTPYGNCQTPSITMHGFNKCFLNPGLFKNTNKMNGNNEISPSRRTDVMFQCCLQKRATVCVCFHCESVFHYTCAKKLNHIQYIGKVKIDCCSNRRSNSEESDNKSLSENVEELKKVLCDLKEENHHLKEQVTTLQTQHVQIISSEIDLKKSEETLKKENLIKENNLLKRLVDEMGSKNELLTEKNDMLIKKLNKKSLCLRQRFGRVLKRTRKRPMNSVEPKEEL